MSTESINYSSEIGFKQFITYLTEYAETWTNGHRNAILANAIRFQDAGLRVSLRNWSILKDEYDRLARRASITFADSMGRALDESTAEQQDAARKQALIEYQDNMEIAELTRRRIESYKQVLDDLILFASIGD